MRDKLYHRAMMCVWGVQMAACPLLVHGWKLYLLEISLYANFASHWSGLTASKPTEPTKENAT